MEYLGKWSAALSPDPHADKIGAAGEGDHYALMRLRFGRWAPLAWFIDKEAAQDFTYVMNHFMDHLPLQRAGGASPHEDPFWEFGTAARVGDV